jgi:hypothetical protein
MTRTEALRVIALLDRVEALEGALRECAEALASDVECRYERTKDYPVMRRRYDRDMGPVLRARALLTDSEDRADG